MRYLLILIILFCGDVAFAITPLQFNELSDKEKKDIICTSLMNLLQNTQNCTFSYTTTKSQCEADINTFHVTKAEEPFSISEFTVARNVSNFKITKKWKGAPFTDDYDTIEEESYNAADGVVKLLKQVSHKKFGMVTNSGVLCTDNNLLSYFDVSCWCKTFKHEHAWQYMDSFTICGFLLSSADAQWEFGKDTFDISVKIPDRYCSTSDGVSGFRIVHFNKDLVPVQQIRKLYAADGTDILSQKITVEQDMIDDGIFGPKIITCITHYKDTDKKKFKGDATLSQTKVHTGKLFDVKTEDTELIFPKDTLVFDELNQNTYYSTGNKEVVFPSMAKEQEQTGGAATWLIVGLFVLIVVVICFRFYLKKL